MLLRTGLLASCFAVLLFAAWGANRPQGRNIGVEAYPDEIEHPEFEIPADGDEKTEWAFARLRYPSYNPYVPGAQVYYSWGIDSPRSDRHFVQGVRRLTRVQARSVEEVVQFDTELFKWPWIYAVEVGHWLLNDREAAHLREYLLRGGFLMTDDFHGPQEWSIFMQSMRKVFPDRPVVDIPDKDPIFHVLYDLESKIQVPGINPWQRGITYEHGGVTPVWKGVYDDKNRLMVAICHNQDNGDAWEWADAPSYPEKFASQAYRLGINYVIYSMTH